MRFQWLCVCLRLGAGPQVALKPWIKRWFTVASSFERQSGGRFKRPLPKWAKYESFVSSWKCYQCCWGDRGAGEEKQIPCKTNCCLFTSCVLHNICLRFQNIYLKMYLCSLHCFCMSLRFEAQNIVLLDKKAWQLTVWHQLIKLAKKRSPTAHFYAAIFF